MRSMRLKISVSGVRGVVGETLTPQLLTRFAQAFGTYVGCGKVLVGRDTRPSGTMVSHAVRAGLMSTGCRPVDVGIAPIPAIQHACATRNDVRGAVVITASHNPAEWNALKLLSHRGLFLGTLEANMLLDIYHQGTFRRIMGTEHCRADHDEGAWAGHQNAVVAQVDTGAIARAKLKVAVDCVNGAGAMATPALLSRLGCSVLPIACEPTGHFVRPPEPLPEHLSTLCQRVRKGSAQVGFAQDADADRLAVVTEEGVALEGDVMLALLVDLALRRTPGPVVVNLSTSNLIEWVAERHQVPVYRSPVGEANVVEEMVLRQAVVGGEGSGGFIFPAVHYCRDSFSAMALILEYLARGGKLSRWVARLPPRVRIATRKTLPSQTARHILFRLRHAFEDAQVDLRDGVKAIWPTQWAHVRSSNTEPILRIAVEAESEEKAQALSRKVLTLLDRLQTDV